VKGSLLASLASLALLPKAFSTTAAASSLASQLYCPRFEAGERAVAGGESPSSTSSAFGLTFLARENDVDVEEDDWLGAGLRGEEVETIPLQMAALRGKGKEEIFLLRQPEAIAGVPFFGALSQRTDGYSSAKASVGGRELR